MAEDKQIRLAGLLYLAVPGTKRRALMAHFGGPLAGLEGRKSPIDWVMRDKVSAVAAKALLISERAGADAGNGQGRAASREQSRAERLTLFGEGG